MLPYQPGTNFTWLEALGGSYEIALNGVRALNQAHPFEFELTLN
jgi:hypothetical protein